MRYLFLISSFCIVAFGQPAWVPGFGILAAVFGYALFWQAMLTFDRTRDRVLIATLWFASVQGVQLSWLATTDYMGFFIIPFYLFLILGMGIQFGMISFFVNRSIPWHRIFAVAGSWVICECSRLFFLCGYTWNPSGLALADSPYSLQFASIFGIFGLSFWVIFVNLAGLKAWSERSMRQGALWAAIALFPYLFGFVHQTWIESHIPCSKTISVALVQTHLAPEQKEFDAKTPEAYVHPLDQWEQICNALKEKKQVDLIILPEAALPLGAHKANYDLVFAKSFFPEELFPPLKRPYAIFHQGSWKVSNAFLVQTLANQYNAHVIIGLDDADLSGKYNAAFHFQALNLPYKRYEKQILAPIGEYIPLRNWRRFARFIGKQFGIYSSFDSGKEGKIFDSHVPIGISICLEETFTSLIRELRKKGAELFVSVSNDAYFPNTKLGRQHFDHGRVRAAENGAPLLRSCNSGITGGVDCFGAPFQILTTTDGPAKALFFSFPVRSYSTPYTFWGDSAIIAVSLIAQIASYLLARKKV